MDIKECSSNKKETHVYKLVQFLPFLWTDTDMYTLKKLDLNKSTLEKKQLFHLVNEYISIANNYAVPSKCLLWKNFHLFHINKT